MSDITLRVVGKMFSESDVTDKYALVVTEGSGTEADRAELHGALEAPTTSVTTTTHTVTAGERWLMVDDDTAGGNVTITLLAAATAGDGYRLDIKKLGTTGTVTVTGATIDGESSVILYAKNDFFGIRSNGSTYHITNT